MSETISIKTFKPPLPLVLPARLRLVRDLEDGARFFDAASGLSVIISGAVERDGRRWIHLSVARPHRMPDWDDLVFAKELFLGREAHALQVIPPRSEHVNIHPNCLHLWSCPDERVLPDFTHGSGSL